MNERAYVSLSGLVLQPSRLESYDFKGNDGRQIVGNYFATDLVQATPDGTAVVTVRSEFPLVERPDPSAAVQVDAQLELRNGRVRFTVPKRAAAPNGASAAKPAARPSA